MLLMQDMSWFVSLAEVDSRNGLLLTSRGR